jgi:hypothetical protein
MRTRWVRWTWPRGAVQRSCGRDRGAALTFSNSNMRQKLFCERGGRSMLERKRTGRFAASTCLRCARRSGHGHLPNGGPPFGSQYPGVVWKCVSRCVESLISVRSSFTAHDHAHALKARHNSARNAPFSQPAAWRRCPSLPQSWQAASWPARNRPCTAPRSTHLDEVHAQRFSGRRQERALVHHLIGCGVGTNAWLGARRGAPPRRQRRRATAARARRPRPHRAREGPRPQCHPAQRARRARQTPRPPEPCALRHSNCCSRAHARALAYAPCELVEPARRGLLPALRLVHDGQWALPATSRVSRRRSISHPAQPHLQHVAGQQRRGLSSLLGGEEPARVDWTCRGRAQRLSHASAPASSATRLSRAGPRRPSGSQPAFGAGRSARAARRGRTSGPSSARMMAKSVG